MLSLSSWISLVLIKNFSLTEVGQQEKHDNITRLLNATSNSCFVAIRFGLRLTNHTALFLLFFCVCVCVQALG